MYEELVEALRLCVKYGKAVDVLANALQAADAIEELSKRPEIPATGIGDLSDGYHTFNGLYHQRMVLFAALVNAHQNRAWKSWKHEDGKPCFDGGWFIVGIDTPQGSYTYHFEDKYWNWFECEELPVGKHWDGHTEADVTRLLSLPDLRPVVKADWYIDDGCAYCSNCKNNFNRAVRKIYKFCPMCGAKMED